MNSTVYETLSYADGLQKFKNDGFFLNLSISKIEIFS